VVFLRVVGGGLAGGIKNMDAQIHMISAATKVLSFTKENPMAIDEEVFQNVSDYISGERIKDEKTRRAMIAAASRAYEITRKIQNFQKKM